MPDEHDANQNEPAQPYEEEIAQEEMAPTPFDHPFFLPVLLTGLAAWFGYDGWLNSDPDMAEHVTFNRVGFAVLSVAALYKSIVGYREWKDEQQ